MRTISKHNFTRCQKNCPNGVREENVFSFRELQTKDGMKDEERERDRAEEVQQTMSKQKKVRGHLRSPGTARRERRRGGGGGGGGEKREYKGKGGRGRGP